MSYGQAIHRIYKRRQRLSAGAPVSASVIGTGKDLIYNEGIACYIDQDSVQIRDFHRHGPPQRLSIKFVLRYLPDAPRDCSALRLLNFADGVLTLLFNDEISGTTYLLAIGINARTNPKHLMEPRIVENVNRIFVRNTRDVLFYGVHFTAGTTHGHQEWVIRGISLCRKKFRKYCRTQNCDIDSLDSEAIQLRDFPGSDIGITVAFKIYQGYFYALSNCSEFDVVEVDWTSFYHCIKFPIDDPRERRCTINPRIYRRQHAEGPVNDSWNGLGLQVDERTNELMIVEARTEWPTGGSSHKRTFYAESLSFPDADIEATLGGQKTGPPGDPFTKILDDNSKWSPDQVREPWQNHPEEANIHANIVQGLPMSKYILARTKFQWYNFTAGTFVDIVEDACSCCKPGRLCLQLRIGSRKPDPQMSVKCYKQGPRKPRVPTVYPPSSCPSPLQPSTLSERSRDYVYNPITTWPRKEKRAETAKTAHDIMNLDSDIETHSGIDFKGFADERCIVYLVRPSGTNEDIYGKIVCISFDRDASIPHWNQSKMKKFMKPVTQESKRKQNVNYVEFRAATPPLGDMPIPQSSETALGAYDTVWEDFPDAHELEFDQIWDEWDSTSTSQCHV
jgi:hypothetical protein